MAARAVPRVPSPPAGAGRASVPHRPARTRGGERSFDRRWSLASASAGGGPVPKGRPVPRRRPPAGPPSTDGSRHPGAGVAADRARSIRAGPRRSVGSGGTSRRRCWTVGRPSTERTRSVGSRSVDSATSTSTRIVAAASRAVDPNSHDFQANPIARSRSPSGRPPSRSLRSRPGPWQGPGQCLRAWGSSSRTTPAHSGRSSPPA